MHTTTHAPTRGDPGSIPKATTLQVLVWQDFKRRLWERDGGICGICREPVSQGQMHVDHVIPRSRGGTHEWPNLQTAHRLCNIRKRDGPGPRVRRTRPVLVLKGERGLTVSDAAAQFRVPQATVRRWIREGKLRATMLRGTKTGYRIPESEVDRLLRGTST
jgi:excisionase family DNA binding protein